MCIRKNGFEPIPELHEIIILYLKSSQYSSHIDIIVSMINGIRIYVNDIYI
jgi:hypothetical protein